MRNYLILFLILFLTFLLRLPSLFEPFWYGDEGIFAAVATNLNQGGVLYQTAWDNKPPMIYLTYALIFKIFGVSMFWLRLVTIIVVLATTVLIYEIGEKILGLKRALVAAFIFGLLTSLRIVEGNLALTEIFMLLYICAAMFLVIWQNFKNWSVFLAGLLLATASLYKQVGVLEAAGLGIFLFLLSGNFGEFFKKGLFLVGGFLVPYLLTLGYFIPKKLAGEYIFGAYTYYQIYLGESPQYQLLINIAKFLPIVAAIFLGIIRKIRGEVRLFHLIILWLAFAFLGSYFSGRTYGHYLVQAVAPVSLMLAAITLKINPTLVRAVFVMAFLGPLIFLTRLLFVDFLTGGPINQLKYWQNFVEFALGKKSVSFYNDFFDGNVNTIMALSDFLRSRNAYFENVYIWGDYPWLYAIADLKNPVRYVTSFHVFGVSAGRGEVVEKLAKNPPKYIIKPQSSIGYFLELENLLALNYKSFGKIETSEVFIRKTLGN